MFISNELNYEVTGWVEIVPTVADSIVVSSDDSISNLESIVIQVGGLGYRHQRAHCQIVIRTPSDRISDVLLQRTQPHSIR
ncbi:hypothetical protein E5S67_04488 [Microcoleus sp. IPMA8]|uniref:Uncharacterized protein n=1 Tax=Microcoleus asticus IPMA8 TaxID=2563858 RepID=A0ABX2D3I1_9CYAN|nr:hypothetical protein [Microcoleus asticus IPMA8]